jgi:hypothetical protein
VALAHDEQATLDVLTEHIAGVVLAAAVRLAPAEPVAQLALLAGQAEADWDIAVPEIAVRTSAERDRALEGRTGTDRFDAAWTTAHDWATAEVRDPRPDAEVRVRLQGLHDALAAAGILDPALWVLWRVAQELSLKEMPCPVTADFVAFVFDGDGEHEQTLADALAFAAPAQARAALVEAQLLPVRYLHELDAPLDADAIEEVVAELQAETDDDLEATGRWDVTCHVQGAEGGLWGVSFDDATDFARRFTDVIRIRDYSGADREERFYSAGARPIPGLPAWPPRR